MNYVSIPGTRVELLPPEGFQKATGFQGFEHPGFEATLGVTELPMSLEALAERWAPLPTKVRERIEVQGVPALWVHAQEDIPSGDVLRWLLAIAAGEHTVVVVGAAPALCPGALLKALEQSVRSARLLSAPSPGDELPFHFDAGDRLQVAARMGTVVLLTEGGAVGKDALAPMLTLGVGSSEEGTEDLVKLAGHHLQAVPGLVDFEQLEGEYLTTPAGDRAYQVLGTAMFRGVDAQVTLYQLLVVHSSPDGTEQVWLAVGRVAALLAGEWASEMAGVAMSLQDVTPA